jgi:hypothetical protein
MSKPLSYVMGTALRQAASNVGLRVADLKAFLVKAVDSRAARANDPRNISLEIASSSLVGTAFARGADNLEVFVVIRKRETGIAAGASRGAVVCSLAHALVVTVARQGILALG